MYLVLECVNYEAAVDFEWARVLGQIGFDEQRASQKQKAYGIKYAHYEVSIGVVLNGLDRSSVKLAKVCFKNFFCK